MKQVFDRMAKLRTYVDDNFSGRDWNLATAMVIQGKAGMQMMGDWAKGEFLNAGKKPGVGLPLLPPPGHPGHGHFNTDQFVMFKVAMSNARPDRARQVDHGAFVPVGVQRGQGLGAGAHRRLG